MAVDQGAVRVAGAVDRDVRDRPVDHIRPENLTAVPRLSVLIPLLLHLEDEPSCGGVETRSWHPPTTGWPALRPATMSSTPSNCRRRCGIVKSQKASTVKRPAGGTPISRKVMNLAASSRPRYSSVVIMGVLRFHRVGSFAYGYGRNFQIHNVTLGRNPCDGASRSTTHSMTTLRPSDRSKSTFIGDQPAADGTSAIVVLTYWGPSPS